MSRCCRTREALIARVALVARTESCSKQCSGARVPVRPVEWMDLPPEYGCWQTVYTRFSRWSRKDVLKRVFDRLSQERDGEGKMIDGTIVRAHQDATGAAKKAANKRLAVLAAVHRRSSTR